MKAKKLMRSLWLQLFAVLVLVHIASFSRLSLHFEREEDRIFIISPLSSRRTKKAFATGTSSDDGLQNGLNIQQEGTKLLHITTTGIKDSNITEEDESLKKLRKLGIFQLSEEQRRQIPPWSQVQELYGSEPVILGLETCQAYREAVPYGHRIIAPAGMFNTGTNLFPLFFHNNCKDFTRRLMQVMWGKHNLALARRENFQLNNTSYKGFTNDEVMPIVMVRHPLSWMFSTCIKSYGAHWKHTEGNCPHLVDQNNAEKFVPVRVSYGWNPGAGKNTKHTSLIHLWRDWYQSYMTDVPLSEFPRIIVRLEDVVYHPEKVIDKICDCVGGTLEEDVKIPEKSVKIMKEELRRAKGLKGSLTGGKDTAGLVKAWVEHASIHSLWHRMAPRDQQAVIGVLNGDNLIQRLNYKINF